MQFNIIIRWLVLILLSLSISCSKNNSSKDQPTDQDGDSHGDGDIGPIPFDPAPVYENPGTLININFGDLAKVGTAALGIDGNDIWNAYSKTEFDASQPVVLKNADGSNSSAELTVEGAGGFGQVDAPDTMLESYLASRLWDGIKMSITGMPEGSYDIILYGRGDKDARRGIFELNVQDQGYGIRGTNQNTKWREQGWIEGEQFVVFRNVQVDSNENLELIVGLVGGEVLADTALISGIQIAGPSQIPAEPNPKPPRRISGSLINVQFTARACPFRAPNMGVAATGTSNEDYWNFYSAFGALGSENLVKQVHLATADRTITNVNLTAWRASTGWSYTNEAYPMIQHYVNAPARINFLNLPQGQYDIYVYGHGGTDEQAGVFEITSGNNSYGIRGTITKPGWKSEVLKEGIQYVIFRDILIEDKQNLELVAYNVPGHKFAGALNAIQIVCQSGCESIPTDLCTCDISNKCDTKCHFCDPDCYPCDGRCEKDPTIPACYVSDSPNCPCDVDETCSADCTLCDPDCVPCTCDESPDFCSFYCYNCDPECVKDPNGTYLVCEDNNDLIVYGCDVGGFCEEACDDSSYICQNYLDGFRCIESIGHCFYPLDCFSGYVMETCYATDYPCMVEGFECNEVITHCALPCSNDADCLNDECCHNGFCTPFRYCGAACTEDEFECFSGMCIDKDFECDNWSQGPDCQTTFTDEQNCP